MEPTFPTVKNNGAQGTGGGDIYPTPTPKTSLEIYQILAPPSQEKDKTQVQGAPGTTKQFWVGCMEIFKSHLIRNKTYKMKDRRTQSDYIIAAAQTMIC